MIISCLPPELKTCLELLLCFLFELISHVGENVISLLSIAILLALLFLVRHFLLSKKYTIRDSSYILRLSNSENGRSPATSRKRLAEQLLGNGYSKADFSAINQIIDNNTRVLKSFFKHEYIDDVLVLDSRWGTGKTTSVLIAINEASDVPSNRYIYESAFKYTSGLSEFTKDLLSTLFDTMQEVGIKLPTRGIIRNLLNNYDPDLVKTIVNLVAGEKNDSLTSDLVMNINENYLRSGKKAFIFVIIDDLDRLFGDDLLRALSFLSMLRRLTFVKIIVPADLELIKKSLKSCGVPDAGLFLDKYLPGQLSVKIASGYDVAEAIFNSRMTSKYKTFSPAVFAAVLFKMIANKLKDCTLDIENDRVIWLTNMPGQEKIEGIDGIAKRIITTAPAYLRERSGWKVGGRCGKYEWDAVLGGGRKSLSVRIFESILYQLKFGPNKEKYVRDSFSIDEYNTLVASWIFAYARIHWDEYGFSIREVLDLLSYLDLDIDDLPKTEEEQFVSAFNCFFPNRKLTVSPRKTAES